MEKEKVYLEISWGTLWKIFIFLTLIAAFYYFRFIVLAFFAAIVIASALEPFINFFEKRGVPRILSILIIILFLILFFGTITYFIFPIFSAQLSDFLERFNEIIFVFLNLKSPPSFITNLTSGFEKVLGFFALNEASLREVISKIFPNLLLAVATIIISLLLMVEKDGVERFIKAALSTSYERSALHIFYGFKVKIRRWILTQLMMSLLVGFMTGGGLWLLGVKASLLLGFLAAVFEIVPVIGPVFVGFLAFLIALSNSFILGIYTVLLFIFIQQFESHVLIPLVFGRTMNIHPVIIILAILAGSQIAGFLGFILAVPFAILIQEIFAYFTAKKAKHLSLGI